MQLISFLYDKQDGSSAKRYFVGVKSHDKEYIHGYDLVSGGYKKFIPQRVVSQITSHGDMPTVDVLGSSVVSRDELIRRFGLDDRNVQLLAELNVTNEQLLRVFNKRTGNADLLGDHFIIFGDRYTLANVYVNGIGLTAKITPSEVEFYSLKGDRMSYAEVIQLDRK